MPVTAAPGESYTIRRKVFKIFGAGFHIYDHEGNVVGYCKQKAFRFKESMKVFTSDDEAEELFRIQARSVIDFGATYDVLTPDGSVLGSARRKGLKSMLRDQWLVFDASQHEIGKLTEDSTSLAVIRRVIELAAVLIPQKLNLVLNDGTEVARYRTHVNPFIYKLGVTVTQDHEQIDDLMILAIGCMFAAIDGRQDSA